MSPYGVLPPAPGLSFAYIYSPTSESTIGYLPFWPILLGGIYKLYALIGIQDQYFYYFLLKQPVILADVLLGYLILRYVRANRPGASNVFMAYWLLSPYTVIISGVWGMFDSLAMLPVVAALITTKETYRSSLGGVAIWVKSIPLIYAIPLAFSGPHRMRNLAVSLAIPALGSLAIIALTGWPILTALVTLKSTVTKGGQSLSALGLFFYLIQFNIVSAWPPVVMSLLGYVWVPAELVSAFLGYRWYGFTTARGLVQSLILGSLTFMIFKAQVNEQYAVYLLALVLIDVAVWNPDRKWLYVSITAAALAFLLVNNVFLVRFTAASNPGWIVTEIAWSNAMGQARTAGLLISSMSFVALNIFYVYLLYCGRDRGALPLRAGVKPAVDIAPDVREAR
ncbi:MAG: hypothetical protein OK474_06805 [Thaumarchaeota archaeon]|nr:hypothetical protein [Nitrososphaerota archaeon]